MNKSVITIAVLLFLAVIQAACIQADVTDTISFTRTLSFPTPQIASSFVITCDQGGPVFNTSINVSLDLHDYFTQLSKQGPLTVDFNQNTLSGDLSSFRHAQMFIAGAVGQPVLLAETDFVGISGMVDVPFKMSNDVLLGLLEDGPVTLVINLATCIPSAGLLEIKYTLGASVQASIKKGI